MNVAEEIKRLKAERNAVILAHYYVPDEVQAVADYTGDSFYLAKVAAASDADCIVFAGVRFMGESTKILSPRKTVYLPVPAADCPMAHMVTEEQIEHIRRTVEDVAVVCYINSSAALKTHADVCVTSSNALRIVKALPQKNIYFIPDDNLGRFVAEQVPEKRFYFCGGHCPVHHRLTAEEVRAAKAAHPECKVLVHPECPKEVVDLADYAGSTAGILQYCRDSAADAFLIGTERGIFYQLKRSCPEKKFYLLSETLTCPDMKEITLASVLAALRGEVPAVELEESVRAAANRPLQAMLALGK